MNASEKVSDFRRAAEKTGMQFGIAFDENESRTIQIRGFQSMPNELQEYCKPMWGIFSDLQKKCRNIIVCRES